MANKTEERLLNEFDQASGGRISGDTGGSDSSPTPAKEDPSHAESEATTPKEVRSYADSASGDAAAPAETSAFEPSSDSGAGQSYHGTSGTSSSSSASSGGSSALESLAGSVFGGALGLLPLAGALVGLFDGKSTQPQVFQKYEMPSSISFEAADTGGGLVNAGYDQMGLPRLYDSSEPDPSSGGSGASGASVAPASSSGAANSPAGGGTAGATTGGTPAGAPQISVNVQAMDAQSFMSYSGEIAKAVRDAMLNLSSINDVVTEL